jgi:hypothetical protein
MTGVEFVLPKGYLSPQGQLLRHGTMRLATAKDELEVRADQRAIANPDYGTLLLLSRLITIQSAPNPLQPEHLEQLFIQDYFYLQDLYHQLHPYGFYDQERLYEEISFIAFYFHWNLEDILQFTHSDRRRWVEQISKLLNAS